MKRTDDINSRDSLGAQAIHCAAYRGRLRAVKYLVENGADVNSRGPGGATPLLLASMASHMTVMGGDYPGVVGFLIEKGADVNAKNTSGYSPLHFAKNRKVIKLLRKAGAKKKEVCAKKAHGSERNVE